MRSRHLIRTVMTLVLTLCLSIVWSAPEAVTTTEAKNAEKVAEKLADKEKAAEREGKAAERAQKRKELAKEAQERRMQESEGAGKSGAKIIHASHVLYMKDGTKLACSILMTGEKSIVVLTEDGELELKPADIERTVEVEVEEQTSPVYASTQLFEGNEYLTAPEVEEKEEDAEEEGEEEEAADDATDGGGDLLIKPEEAPRILNVPDVPLLDASKLGLPGATPLDLKPEPTRILGAPAQATVPDDAGAEPEAPKAVPEQKGSVTSQPQKARPTSKPVVKGTTTKPAATPKDQPVAKQPREEPEQKKADGGQGFTDLLKSLESKDGLNSVLDQLKNNPDFYKTIDINK